MRTPLQTVSKYLTLFCATAALLLTVACSDKDKNAGPGSAAGSGDGPVTVNSSTTLATLFPTSSWCTVEQDGGVSFITIITPKDGMSGEISTDLYQDNTLGNDDGISEFRYSISGNSISFTENESNESHLFDTEITLEDDVVGIIFSATNGDEPIETFACDAQGQPR